MEEEKVFCADCGVEYPISELFKVGDKWICEECAEEGIATETYFKCDHCDHYYTFLERHYDVNTEEGIEVWCEACKQNHTWICEDCDEIFSDDMDKTTLGNGDEICEDCRENNGYFYCDRCDECYPDNYANTVHTNGYDECWCDDCMEQHTWICEDCDEIFSDNLDFTVIHGHRHSRYVCPDCAENDYYYRCCENCGEMWHIDDMHSDGYGDYYCPNCECYVDSYEGLKIYDWHDAPNEWRLHWTGQEDEEVGFGLEIEMDKGGRYPENAYKIIEASGFEPADEEHFYVCLDASIPHGYEFITQPCSYEYHREKVNYDEMFKKAIELGYRAHDAGTCGLHMHISRKYFADAFESPNEMLALLVNNNVEWLFKFSRRKEKDYHYCKFNDIGKKISFKKFKQFEKTYEDRMEENNIMDEMLAKYHSNENMNYGWDRYNCINFQHNATIEFRFYRGTLNINTFWACLQLTWMMAYFAKHFRREQVCKINLHWFLRLAKRKGFVEFINYCKEKEIA